MSTYELEPTNEHLINSLNTDLFRSRNQQLNELAKVLDSSKNHLTIAVDGQWGCGKTFFVSQLKYLIDNIHELEKEVKCPSAIDGRVFESLYDHTWTLYYNAWENDLHDNPLESLILALINESPKLQQKVNFNKFKTGISAFVENFLRTSSKNILPTKEQITQAKTYENLASHVITVEEKIIGFRDMISNILTDGQKLLLIVDELDRCRPDFAVKMLEVLKHFCDSNLINTIVSVNNTELANVVKKFYGDGFDGYGYLSKIYDFSLNLEPIKTEEYLDHYFSNFAEGTGTRGEIIVFIMKYYNFSLRQYNRFMRLYDFAQPYVSPSSYCHLDKHANFNISKFFLVPLALALKVKDADMFERFITGKGNNIVQDFAKNAEFQKEFGSWLQELSSYESNPSAQLEDILAREYRRMFADDISMNPHGRFPLFRALATLSLPVNE